MNVQEWEEQRLIAELGAIPVLCPTCGSNRVVRVLWQRAMYGGPKRSFF